MKETIKVSIGGYVFTLDVDAYQALETYLNNLRRYFENKSDGAEILNDIEYRMSELLQLKLTTPSTIVTLPDARNIIELMGNPAEFDAVEDEQSERVESGMNSKKKESVLDNKKLYRDKDNSVIAGVCSGLGHYFNVDPVIVRIIYGIGFIGGHSIYDKLGGAIFISYILLWIAMPAAKTFKQKLAMSGQDPSIEDIETGNLKVKKMRGSNLGRILGKLMKISVSLFLFLIGLPLALTAIILLALPGKFSFPTITNILETTGMYSSANLIAICIVCLLPALIFIYWAIRLLFKVRTKDFAILGVSLAIWVTACCYLAIAGGSYARNDKHEASNIERLSPTFSSDTITVRLDKSLTDAEMVSNINMLYVLEGSPKSWFVIPSIEIKKDSIYKNVEIEIKKTAFGKNRRIAEKNAQNTTLDLKALSSNIVITPQLYNKDNIWNRETFTVIIYVPEGKTIILEEPF